MAQVKGFIFNRLVNINGNGGKDCDQLPAFPPFPNDFKSSPALDNRNTGFFNKALIVQFLLYNTHQDAT